MKTFLDLSDEARRKVYARILPRRHYTFDVADQEFANELNRSPEHTEQCKKAKDCISVMCVSHKIHQELCPLLYSHIKFDVMVHANPTCSHFFDKFSDFSASMIQSPMLTLRHGIRSEKFNPDPPTIIMFPTFAALNRALRRLTGLQILTLVYVRPDPYQLRSTLGDIAPTDHDVVLCPGNDDYIATTTNFGRATRELLKRVGHALPRLGYAVYPSDRPLWDTLFTFSHRAGALTKDGGRHVYIDFDPLSPNESGQSTDGQIESLRTALARRSALGTRDPILADCIEQLVWGISLKDMEFWINHAGQVTLGYMVPVEDLDRYTLLGMGANWL